MGINAELAAAFPGRRPGRRQASRPGPRSGGCGQEERHAHPERRRLTPYRQFLRLGSTGRPDLLGQAHGGDLAHAQYAPARRLAAELPADADVVLNLDEDSYVAQTLAGLDAYPAYYAHIGPANAAGRSAPT